jgi:hypothetical protein
MEKQFLGLTTKDIKQIACQLAKRNKPSYQFSQDKQQAGKKLFMKRHPELLLRQSQAASAARVKENVSNFFSILIIIIIIIIMNYFRVRPSGPFLSNSNLSC